MPDPSGKDLHGILVKLLNLPDKKSGTFNF